MRVTDANYWYVSALAFQAFVQVYGTDAITTDYPDPTGLFISSRSQLPDTNNRFNNVEQLKASGDLTTADIGQAFGSVTVGAECSVRFEVESDDQHIRYVDFAWTRRDETAYLFGWYRAQRFVDILRDSSLPDEQRIQVSVSPVIRMFYRKALDQGNGASTVNFSGNVLTPRDSWRPGLNLSLMANPDSDLYSGLIGCLSDADERLGVLMSYQRSNYWIHAPWSFSLASKGDVGNPEEILWYNYQEKILPYLPSEFAPNVWGRLAAEAYASNEFWSGNGFALGKDLKDFRKAAEDTAKSISILASKSKIGRRIKSIANLFLGFVFGWKLLVSDLHDLSLAFANWDKEKTSRCQAQMVVDYKSGASVTYRYQVFYNMFGKLTEPIDTLYEMFDLVPDLSNSWDSIPYSFVVDWFVSVGDCLQQIDSYLSFQQQHKVLAVGKSIKATLTIDGVTITYYKRWYSNRLQIPDWSLQSTYNPRVITFLEGGALVIQKT